MKVWTKICGITCANDAAAAAEAGADAIGVNFCVTSPRYTQGDAAREIARAVAGAVEIYGVFAGAAAENIAEMVAVAPLGGVQLHGNEDAGFIARLRELVGADVKLIRAFPVSSGAAVVEALQSATGPRAAGYRVLLDSPVGGGSGTCFAAALVAGLDLSDAIVAGGLTPANVADVVTRLRPYGVDVASGVERAPGVKDHMKIREFIEHAKRSAS